MVNDILEKVIKARNKFLINNINISPNELFIGLLEKQELQKYICIIENIKEEEFIISFYDKLKFLGLNVRIIDIHSCLEVSFNQYY